MQSQPAKHRPMGRMNATTDGLKRFWPVEAKHSVKQFLGLGEILDPRKAVIVTDVPHVSFVHSPREPFATVHANLKGKGKPRLNSGRHKPETRIDPVVIDKLAFSIPGNDFKDLFVAVSIDFKRLARFDACENADEPVGNPIPRGNFSGIIVFACRRRIKVLDRSTKSLGFGERRLDELSSHLLSMLAKVLKQRADTRKISCHALGETKHSQRTAKNHPVPTVQLPRDMFGIFLHNGIHGVPLLVKVFVMKTLPYQKLERLFKYFGCGYAALGLSVVS